METTQEQPNATPASEESSKPWYKELPPITTAVIIVCTILYLVQCIIDGSLFETSQETLIKMGGLLNLYVYTGEYWRIFTAFWMHHGIVHLIGNMLMLFFMGWVVELLTGKIFYGTLLLVAAVCGCCWSFYYYSDRVVYLVGFSDAVLAVIGAYLGWILVVKGLSFFIEDKKQLFYVPALILVSIVGESSQNPDIFGHLVGFGCGLLLSAVYLVFKEKLHQPKSAYISLLVVSGLLLYSGYYALTHASEDIISYFKIVQYTQEKHSELVDRLNALLLEERNPENQALADTVLKEFNMLIGMQYLIDNLNVEEKLKQRELLQRQMVMNDRDFFKMVYTYTINDLNADTLLFKNHNARKDSLWNAYENYF